MTYVAKVWPELAAQRELRCISIGHGHYTPGEARSFALEIQEVAEEAERLLREAKVAQVVDINAPHDADTVQDLRSTSLRYVELAWSDTVGKITFTCCIVNAPSTKDALVEAKKLLRVRHPEAINVDEFLQRRISEKTSQRIQRRMADGTWQG